MQVEKLDDGYAICADSAEANTVVQVKQLTGDLPLIVADPPYGNILPAFWDRFMEGDDRFAHWMMYWTTLWQRTMLPNAAFYVWGGIGTPGFRPFFKYLVKVENETPLRLANLITWKKRRAYGVQHNYLFTREECAYFINGPDIKKPRCFNVPLLDEKRGYPGYDKKHPAKSEFYRRTNVWTDVTELMRGKVHDAQKAQRVIEVPIEVHTNPGEWVVDPFAGSGTTAFAARKLGRRFVVIEKDPETFERMLHRLTHMRELGDGQWVVLNHAQDSAEGHDSSTVTGNEEAHDRPASG